MGWQMVGHQWAVDLLRRHMSMERVRHAYLFTGADGVGKRTLALRFAQALACTSAPQAGDYCARCRACDLVSRQVHPDLHLVTAADEGETLQVGQVRELQRQVALSPLEGQRRYALLLRFHQATIGASNALLKLLEEPPAHVVLLLTARSADSLLPTIVSRCDRIHLRPVPIKDLEAGLLERGVAKEKARLLAAVAGGRPGDALRLADDAEAMEERSRHLDDFIGLLRETRSQRFGYAARFDPKQYGGRRAVEARREAAKLIEEWRRLLRGVMMLSIGAQSPTDTPDRESDIGRLAACLEAGSIVAAMHSMEATLEALAGNANPRLAMETLLLDLPRIAE